MKKSAVILGSQIQEKFEKARTFVADLDLSDHPLGITISELSAQTQQLLAMLKTDSTNSSLPPSQDPHREKESTAKKGKKAGGQRGHKGTRLVPFEKPDKIIRLEVDKTLLTPDAQLIGVKKAQVVEFTSQRLVIEYQAPIYKLPDGLEISADFPKGITGDIQYGQSVKAAVAYSSVYQFVPYRRIVNMLIDQLHIPISEGSVFNFLREAHRRLEGFEYWLKRKLTDSMLLHVDETGINVNGKSAWIHTVANEIYTLLVPHAKRGREAIDEIGILPDYAGLVCHDCWSSYFAYNDVTHVLCNAHIMRELKGAEEKYDCRWARRMHALFQAMYKVCKDSGGSVSEETRKKLRVRYRHILTSGEKECEVKKDEGKQKRTKPQNLLLRLREHEEAVLRFLEDSAIPFTNNLAENALRMTKVHQKISGCFRTMEGAKYFCRIRSYLSTCLKNGVSSMEALILLFNDKMPDFIDLDAYPLPTAE